MLRAFRSNTIAVACLDLLACSTWRPLPAPLPEHLAAKQENTIRLTLADGQVIELDTPRVAEDSLVGFTPGLRARTAIPLDQITMAEHSRTSLHTTGLVVLGAAAAAGFVVVMWQASEMCLDRC